MNSKLKPWSKTELQIYILILCANADNVELEEEINFIKRKVDDATFKKIRAEFYNDTEEERFEKIDTAIQRHEFAPLELQNFRKEVYDLFLSDSDYSFLEKRLDEVLDNMLY